MRLAYYPGCSLESSSEAYDRSVRAVCRALEIELSDVSDWNCCGATEFNVLNRTAASALVARNLARVDPGLDQLVAPCAACYLNLKKTDALLGEHAESRARVAAALAAGGLSYTPGRLQVRHIVEVIHREVGEAGLAARRRRPLYGLRVAPYSGCQLVRPDFGIDDPEQPRMLGDLLRWLGATVVDYPVKSHCCGGHMTQISDELSMELIRRLLFSADQARADVLACACPMCQLNLDAYQGRVNNTFNTSYDLPVLFFTQLIGVALGLPADELGLGSEIVPAGQVLEEKILDEPPKRTRAPFDRRALPRPGRRGVDA